MLISKSVDLQRVKGLKAARPELGEELFMGDGQLILVVQVCSRFHDFEHEIPRKGSQLPTRGISSLLKVKTNKEGKREKQQKML